MELLRKIGLADSLRKLGEFGASILFMQLPSNIFNICHAETSMQESPAIFHTPS